MISNPETQHQDDIIKELRIRKEQKSHHGIRDPFEKDYARIVHSCYVRRLQGKTQIFSLNSCDFYRTRLTHSMEVSQLSMGLLHHLQKKYENNVHIKSLFPSDLLMMAIGLGHDIGHPPFGHGGEYMLNTCVYKHKGYSGVFEGNAQNLHIAGSLGEYQSDYGMNLTRRTLLGLLKYPISYSNSVVRCTKPDKEKVDNLKPFKPPKCFYDLDQTLIEWVLNPFPNSIKDAFMECENNPSEYNKSKYKSLDCSIMDIADDISNGVHDLEDGIYLGLVGREDWEKIVLKDVSRSFINTNLKSIDCDIRPSNIEGLTDYLFSNESEKRKKAISRLANMLVSNCRIGINPWDSQEASILAYKAELEDDAADLVKLLKKLIEVTILKSDAVRAFTYKGQEVIKKLFEAYYYDTEKTMKNSKIIKLYKKIETKKEDENTTKVDFIRDYIAGMTDSYAIRAYDRLYTPNYDSMFDRL